MVVDVSPEKWYDDFVAYCYANLKGENMFDLAQLKVVRSALTVQHKSVMRLAAKEGQPESVAAEYRKVSQEVADVFKLVESEMVKLEQAAKAAAEAAAKAPKKP